MTMEYLDITVVAVGLQVDTAGIYSRLGQSKYFRTVSGKLLDSLVWGNKVNVGKTSLEDASSL